MAKAAILVPYRDMCDLARPLVDQFSNLTPMCVEYTRTNQIGKRTLELEKQGCELIVARGVQAGIARLLPVVEIRITTQELAVLVTSLRDKLKSEYPRLGLIGFAKGHGQLQRAVPGRPALLLRLRQRGTGRRGGARRR